MAIRLRQHNRAGALLALVAVLALLAVACQGSSAELSLEERAQALDKELMCPVCPSETIDQSQVELAKQMRAIVRERLADGESEQEIKDFFVDRYGDSVLAAPPARGFNIVVWVVAGTGASNRRGQPGTGSKGDATAWGNRTRTSPAQSGR